MMHRASGRYCLAVRSGFRFIHRFLSESVVTCLIAGMAILGAVPEALAEPPLFRLDIKTGPAHESLYALAMQTGVTIVVVTKGSPLPLPQTNAVSGSFSASDALDRMLAETGLVYTQYGRGRFAVRREPGALHWYEIPPAPALDGLRAFVNALGWEAEVDPDFAQRARLAAVHGCFTPENAARTLLAGSPFSYEWKPDKDASPPAKGLILHAPFRQRIKRLFDRNNDTTLITPDAIGPPYCWRLCDIEGEAPRPPQTCVRYWSPPVPLS